MFRPKSRQMSMRRVACSAPISPQAAIKGKRDRVIISTKATFRSGDGPNDVGSSRYHLINACEKALKRLGTDYIDIFQLHGFDARTPIEETLSALDDLVRAGEIAKVTIQMGE